MSRLPFLHDLYISHDAALLHEYIGSLFSMLSADRYSVKLVVMRHSYSLMSSLHYHVPEMRDRLFHVHKQRALFRDAHALMIRVPILHINSRALNNAFLLEYGFFSQVEWRYVRATFHKLMFSSTVVHRRIQDITIRNSAFVEKSARLRQGHLLLLCPVLRDISTSSLIQNATYLAAFLSRSRTDENIYDFDLFSELSNDLSDREYTFVGTELEHESHLAVEEQFIMSGFFIDGNMCTMPELFTIASFTYLDYFYAMHALYNNAGTFLLHANMYYILRAIQHLEYACLCYVKCIGTLYFFSFFYSDYYNYEYF